jgi:hypothetical protein
VLAAHRHRLARLASVGEALAALPPAQRRNTPLGQRLAALHARGMLCRALRTGCVCCYLVVVVLLLLLLIVVSINLVGGDSGASCFFFRNSITVCVFHPRTFFHGSAQ